MRMPENICDFKAQLERMDVQVSAPRLAIASFVLNTDTHPTAEDVKKAVEKFFPTVSLATVYNTLNLFVEKGILREIKDPRSDSLCYDCNTHDHYHFVDEETGRLMDIPVTAFKVTRNTQVLGDEFQVSSLDILLRGKINPKSKRKDR